MAEEEKVELDVKEVSSDTEEDKENGEMLISRAEQKVELDLDDAPFLEEVEEKEEEPEPIEEVEPEEKEEKIKIEEEEKQETPKKKKKLILFGILFLIILLGIAAFFLFRGEKKEQKKEEQIPPKPVVVQEQPPPPPPKLYQFSLRPFWIDYKVNNGHRFLHLTLVLEYDVDILNWELKRKNIVIRDALYYYLKNKNFNFLLDKKNIPVLKKEITTIIDQYLGHGKIKHLYLQNYLIE